MITFDQAYAFQFALFTDEQSDVTYESLSRMPTIVSRPVEGATKNLGLKLSHAQQEHAFIQQAGGAITPGQVLTWRAGSGVWRLNWSHTRVDVLFDARGYAEITESELVPLTEARKRLARNLADLTSVVGRVNRLALVVTGQASCPGPPNASRVVAATFFRAELAEAVARGEVFDPVARANFGTTWQLPHVGSVRINRNEGAASAWALRDGVEGATLSWQLDVNTSPRDNASLTFDSDAIIAFFEQADGWISGRLRALQEIA